MRGDSVVVGSEGREAALWNWISRHAAWVFCALLALNIGLKAPYLGATSLFLDEAVAIHETQGSFAETILFSSTDPTPPFYYLVQGLWCKLFGISELSARFPSMLFSAVTAGLIFLLGRRFFSVPAGLVAALLFTFSNVGIAFAHEARAYALAGLLMTASYYAFLSLADAKQKLWQPALLLVLTNVLLLYTHYLTSMGIAAQALMGLWFLRGRLRAFVYYVGSQLAVLALWLPWLLMNRAQIKDSKVTSWLAPPGWATVQHVWYQLTGPYFLPIFALAIIVVGGLAVARRYAAHRPPQADGFAIATFAMWLLGAIVLQIVVSYLYMPVFELRYALYVLPGVSLLLGSIVVTLPLPAWLRHALVIVYLATAVVGLKLNPPKAEHWREAMAKIKELQDGKTAMVVNAYYQFYPFAYYYNPQYFKDFQHTMPLLGNDSIHLGMDTSLVPTIDDSLVSSVILVLSHDQLTDPTGSLVAFMNRKYCLNGRYIYPGIKLLVYKNPPCASAIGGHFSWDFEQARAPGDAGAIIADPTGDSTNSVTLLGPGHEFSATYTMTARDAYDGNFKSMKISFRAWPQRLDQDLKMVYVMEHDGNSYNWNGIDLNPLLKQGSWADCSISVGVPEIKDPGDQIKIYFWTTEGSTCYFDDLQVDALD